MTAETVSPKSNPASSKGSPKLKPVTSSVLHRVCIQCNNMFPVSPDRFDAKQCPSCHKG